MLKRLFKLVWSPVLAAGVGTLVAIVYCRMAWAFGWPFPRDLAQLLHADGEKAYDAWIDEVWLLSVAGALLIWFVGRTIGPRVESLSSTQARSRPSPPEASSR